MNYGPIFYIPFVVPFTLLLNTRDGLRWTTLAGLGLALAGAGCRLAARSAATPSIVALHLGYVANAVAGPAAMGCVSTLAEAWFPAGERGLATAIASQANQLGAALAFAVGPALVPDTTGAVAADNDIYNILFLALTAVATLAAIVYYPSRPPLPPSLSASGVGHHHAVAAGGAGAAAVAGAGAGAAAVAGAVAGGGDHTLAGAARSLVVLARNRNFVVVALTYGFVNGMMSSWGSTFVLNLRAVGVSQAQAGWISFASVIAGNVGGLLVGGVADRFRNHRAIVLVALFGGAACLAWFALVVAGLLPAAADSGAPALYQVAVAATVAGLCLNSIIPLFYELAVEATFPHVPEATTIMVLTTLNNFGGLCLLFVPISSAAGTFNVIITATVAIMGVAMAVFFRDDSARWKIDASALKLHEAAAGRGKGAGAAGGDEADDDDRHALLGGHMTKVAAAHPH